MILDPPPDFDNDPGLGPEVDRVGGCRGISNGLLISFALGLVVVGLIWWIA